jgi:hypothetical protein
MMLFALLVVLVGLTFNLIINVNSLFVPNAVFFLGIAPFTRESSA